MTKYNEDLVEMVRLLLAEELSWLKISKITKINRRTMQLWRDPNSKFYHEEFAAMVEKSLEREPGK